MNWTRIVLSGVAAGIVGNLYDFVAHGVVMAETYQGLPEVFSQEQANPAYFFAISVCVWIAIAILFAKTRSSWAEGWKGGATYGFFVGLVGFFPNFYNVLVIADWPYNMCWAWGAIRLIGGIVGGAVLGMVYKRA